MPYDLDLAERIRKALTNLPLREGESLTETKMFGGLCFSLNGRMTVGVHDSRLIVRLTDEEFEAGNSSGRVLPMDLTGRRLRNFAFVAEEAFESEADILTWIEKSARFVREHMFDKPDRRRKK